MPIATLFVNFEWGLIIWIILKKLVFFLFYQWNKLSINNQFDDRKGNRNWFIIKISFFMIWSHVFHVNFIEFDICFFGRRSGKILRRISWNFLVFSFLNAFLNWILILCRFFLLFFKYWWKIRFSSWEMINWIFINFIITIYMWSLTTLITESNRF